MPPGTIFGGYEANAQCAGRATQPGGGGGGGASNLWRLMVRRPRGRRSRERAANSVQIGEDGGSARGESHLHGHLGAGESRWHATSPVHPLAVTVHERVDAKASLQRRGPPQSPRLSQPFLP